MLGDLYTKRVLFLFLLLSERLFSLLILLLLLYWFLYVNFPRVRLGGVAGALFRQCLLNVYLYFTIVIRFPWKLADLWVLIIEGMIAVAFLLIILPIALPIRLFKSVVACHILTRIGVSIPVVDLIVGHISRHIKLWSDGRWIWLVIWPHFVLLHFFESIELFLHLVISLLCSDPTPAFA